MLSSDILCKAQKQEKNNFHFPQLQDLDKGIPWENLAKRILSHYQVSNIGRLLVPVESMLRIYFIQLRYNMSASRAEEALFQIKVLRDFAQIDLDTDVIPNASCIKEFNALILVNNLKPEFNLVFNAKAYH